MLPLPVVVLSSYTQLLMDRIRNTNAHHDTGIFHRGLRATGTELTAGNGPGRNTNWSVVDGASLPLP
jgi:hypothetical protein